LQVLGFFLRGKIRRVAVLGGKSEISHYFPCMAHSKDWTHEIIGCAIEVHRELGAGLLESSYEMALCHELSTAGIQCERQVPMPLVYKGERLECGYRTDLIVENSLIVEIKAVERLLPIHEAQLISYLRLSGMNTGLLINFNVLQLRDGLKRLVV
jgi:GxxExxY protein